MNTNKQKKRKWVRLQSGKRHDGKRVKDKKEKRIIQKATHTHKVHPSGLLTRPDNLLLLLSCDMNKPMFVKNARYPDHCKIHLLSKI